VVTPKYIERALKTRTQNEHTGMNDGPAPYISNPTPEVGGTLSQILTYAYILIESKSSP
jgi:hypothetical protein